MTTIEERFARAMTALRAIERGMTGYCCEQDSHCESYAFGMVKIAEAAIKEIEADQAYQEA